MNYQIIIKIFCLIVNTNLKHIVYYRWRSVIVNKTTIISLSAFWLSAITTFDRIIWKSTIRAPTMIPASHRTYEFSGCWMWNALCKHIARKYFRIFSRLFVDIVLISIWKYMSFIVLCKGTLRGKWDFCFTIKWVTVNF